MEDPTHRKIYVHLRWSPGQNVIVQDLPWDISDVCVKFGENQLGIVEMYALVVIHTHTVIYIY